jgi:hypothetical protein
MRPSSSAGVLLCVCVELLQFYIKSDTSIMSVKINFILYYYLKSVIAENTQQINCQLIPLIWVVLHNMVIPSAANNFAVIKEPGVSLVPFTSFCHAVLLNNSSNFENVHNICSDVSFCQCWKFGPAMTSKYMTQPLLRVCF